MDNRWKNYGLWSSILALIPLLLSACGIDLVGEYQEIINAFLAILVTAGIINNPTTTSHGFDDDDKPDDDSL